MDDGVISTDETVRVSDADRERVADRLARAQAEGRLDVPEFDQRVRAAYAAVTRVDLAPLTADLPADVPAPRAGVGVAVGESPRRGLAAAAGVWATVSAVNVAVWAVVALAAAGPVYPWWIWVAGPWGAMLALRALAPPTARPGLTCTAGRRP